MLSRPASDTAGLSAPQPPRTLRTGADAAGTPVRHEVGKHHVADILIGAAGGGPALKSVNHTPAGKARHSVHFVIHAPAAHSLKMRLNSEPCFLLMTISIEAPMKLNCLV